MHQVIVACLLGPESLTCILPTEPVLNAANQPSTLTLVSGKENWDKVWVMWKDHMNSIRRIRKIGERVQPFWKVVKTDNVSTKDFKFLAVTVEQRNCLMPHYHVHRGAIIFLLCEIWAAPWGRRVEGTYCRTLRKVLKHMTIFIEWDEQSKGEGGE